MDYLEHSVSCHFRSYSHGLKCPPWLAKWPLNPPFVLKQVLLDVLATTTILCWYLSSLCYVDERHWRVMSQVLPLRLESCRHSLAKSCSGDETSWPAVKFQTRSRGRLGQRRVSGAKVFKLPFQVQKLPLTTSLGPLVCNPSFHAHWSSEGSTASKAETNVVD